MRDKIDVSVVIPTRNRADLLDRVLDSFAQQSTPPTAFEVVVVDDGSTDGTADACRRTRDGLHVQYVWIARAGSAAAKNAGIAASRGRLVLLADDDDVADPDLVKEHLRVHEENPAVEVVALGYGAWHTALRVTELMHFVTEVGQFLSSYPQLRHGELLDFRYFWSGRVSAKRELLVQCGGFDEGMVALEDVELGYRLSSLGLRVLFTRRAVSYMLRSFDFDAFCARCERTGRGLAHFRQLYPGAISDQYARALLGKHAHELDAADRAAALTVTERRLAALRPVVLDLEQRLDDHGRRRLLPVRLSPARRRLHRLYAMSFRAAMLKGALRANAGSETRPARP